VVKQQKKGLREMKDCKKGGTLDFYQIHRGQAHVGDQGDWDGIIPYQFFSQLSSFWLGGGGEWGCCLGVGFFLMAAFVVKFPVTRLISVQPDDSKMYGEPICA